MNWPWKTASRLSRSPCCAPGAKGGRPLTPEEQTIQDFGKDLFNALIDGEILSRYDVSRREAHQQRKGLRLKLRIQSPELAALPWEFLYDHRRGKYLCLSINTPTIRYLELPQPIPSLKVTPPLRILGMIASPEDLSPLDVDREKQRIEKAIHDLQKKGFLELTWLPGPTWRDLQEAMWGGPWHIFHFIGHGGFDPYSDEGLIALADEQGQKDLLRATQVAHLLTDHYDLRLVLLNACEGARGGKLDIYSSTSAILIRQGIPAVLAMQYEITDRAAIEFSRAFYKALAYGLPIDAAVATARVAVNIAVNNSFEWGTPVLFMRSPDGVLFELTSIPSDKPEPVVVEITEEPPAPEPKPPERRKGRLWVNTEPKEVSVNFLNLRDEFRQGMELEPGSYHVEVRADGYGTKRAWVELESGEDKHINISLTGIKPPPPLEPTPTAEIEAPSEKQFTNSISMQFVHIPPGTFQMGSPEGEKDRWDNEKQHQVTLSRPFYLQTTPVTQGQWEEVMGDNPSYFKECGEDCPVESVSWEAVQEFITKLNRMEKTDTYRLPTEAEWEYACRAGSTTAWCFGDDKVKLGDYAWYDENSGGKIHPVGQLKPNAWGLYDMHGNVWEWCQDWYGEYPAGPVTDPQGPASGERRVLRGGSWYNYAWITRSAKRYYFNPDHRYYYYPGFRVARAL
jgi:formylglycine-generating enzyme required for sulfatase activity